MNLLDLTENPRELGLLSLGLRLMSTPGKFGTALGQAGMGALQDVQQAQSAMDARKMRGLQQQMLEQQLAAAKAQQDEAARQRELQTQFIKSIPSPQSQALGALGADASPTVTNAARMPKVDPQQDFLWNAMQAGQIKPMEYFQSTQKNTEPFKIGKDERLLERGTNRVLVDALPDPAKMSQIAQLSKEMNDLPPGHPLRAVYQSAITRASTHPPATSVSYGAPVAGVDNKGNPVFFQPPKDGGPPVIVPGVKPPPAKLGEKQQNQVAGIDALGGAIDAYVKALGSWKTTDAVNPDKRAEIGTYYNNMMLQAKEAYNLGVLNGPDYTILQDVVRDPLSLMGMVTSNEAMAKQATNLKRLMNKVKAGIKPEQEGADPLGLRK